MSVEQIHSKYIEVVGKSSYELPASNFSLTIRAEHKTGFTKLDVSSAILSKDTEKFLVEIVNTLIENGFPEEKIRFRGTQDFRRWRKKGYDNLRTNALELRHDDYHLMIKVPFWLESLKTGKHTVKFSELWPEYEPDEDKHKTAFAQAVKQATSIATSIAHAGDRILGPMLQVQDLFLYNNNERYSTSLVGGGAIPAGAKQIDDFDFEKPTRKVKVGVRARFAIGDPSIG